MAWIESKMHAETVKIHVENKLKNKQSNKESLVCQCPQRCCHPILGGEHEIILIKLG